MRIRRTLSSEGGREGEREGVGVREIFTRTLVSSRLKWAGHVEKMEGERERLTKRANAPRVEDRRKKKEDRD